MAETPNGYSEGFDIDAYLSYRFTDPRCLEDESLVRIFALQNLHDYFRTVAVEGTTNFKVLDYGCGPVIANVISAASFATEIVLAEYTEEGRTAVRRWLDRDPSCFNWSPYFKYIVQTLEDKSLQEAGDREECVRRVVNILEVRRPVETGRVSVQPPSQCCTAFLRIHSASTISVAKPAALITLAVTGPQP